VNFWQRVLRQLPSALPTLWEISMPKEMFHGMDVISEFKEDEYLFPPYSVFVVKETKWKESPSRQNPNVVRLEAVGDNKEHPEELPLCSWH